MNEAKLKDTLRSLIHRYGFERVNRSLHRIGSSEYRRKSTAKGKEPPAKTAQTKSRKKKAKTSASEYVAKLDVPAGKKPVVIELAKRFEDKSFLPSLGDVREFFRVYGITEPVPKSRASAVPKVFKFIAKMETNEVQGILENGMFSGPSRLGPIADAILRRGDASRRQKL